MTEDLTWLFARQRFGVKPGLGPTRALLAALGEPQRQFDSVLVGGTNGKGSTAATLASMLSAGGRRAGLFTSPHLTHFAERFSVNGEPLPAEVVSGALGEIRPLAEDVGATFFEIVTALGCLLFARAGVRVAVMEVGLGGRYDATNALEPVLSIVTGVALDHRHILGDTVEEIAADKAGIMREDRLCLTGAAGAALDVLKRASGERSARLWTVGEDIQVTTLSQGFDGIAVEVRSPAGELELSSPLLGRHQARNVALAATAGQALGVGEPALRLGAERVRWPGRLELIRSRGRRFLLDGAHNPDAARALAAAMEDLGLSRPLLVFGMSSDKDIRGIVAALDGRAREVIVTRARLSPRAAPPEELRAYWSSPTWPAASPAEALELAVEKSAPDEVILVAGSLYLIGEIRPLLLGEGLEPFERWQ